MKYIIAFLVLTGVFSFCMNQQRTDHGNWPKTKWKIRQLTFAEQNHELDHNENFSFDDQWLVYDTRKDPDGIGSNGKIEKVHVNTGEQKTIYQVPNQNEFGPGVGAASYHPLENKVVFIHGLSNSNARQSYAGHRRTGVIIDENVPEHPVFMDARDIYAPYTRGALRGGTHRHQWSADGNWIGYTYNDAIMVDLEEKTGEIHDLRTIGVSQKSQFPVQVKPDENGENVEGSWFSALVVQVVSHPKPGSDEISRAYGDWWVGNHGYPKSDGSMQLSRAFMGDLVTANGEKITEVFVVDIPDSIHIDSENGKIEGDETRLPMPPKGAGQRRITFTETRKYPGVATEPRHWLSSSPDGKIISYLARDDKGIQQVFFVTPLGGEPRQVTFHETPVQSMVRWHPEGAFINYICDNSLFIQRVENGSLKGKSTRVTPKSDNPPFAACWSRKGDKIAYNQIVKAGNKNFIQIFLAELY